VRIVAILLAAGCGRRIGRPKALLPLGDTSFLATCAGLLDRPGVALRIAVTGCESAAVAAEAARVPLLDVVKNPDYEAGMLGSVLAGLDRAAECGADAILLHPVDHPLVAAATIERVVTALAGGARVVVPSWEMRRGHPLGIAAAAWPSLRGSPAERGARAVLQDHPDWIEYVDGDPGCVAGVNTRMDYERLIGPLEVSPATPLPDRTAADGRGSTG